MVALLRWFAVSHASPAPRSLHDRRLALGVIAASLALGCSEPIQPPALRPEHIATTKMSPSGAEIEALLDAVNPNKSQLSATSIQTKTTIAGRADVARVVVGATLVLPPNQTAKLKLPIRVEWIDPAAVAALAAARQAVPFVVEGTVDFSDGRGSIKAPFQVSGTMSAGELAQAAGAAPSAPPSAVPSAAPSNK